MATIEIFHFFLPSLKSIWVFAQIFLPNMCPLQYFPMDVLTISFYFNLVVTFHRIGIDI